MTVDEDAIDVPLGVRSVVVLSSEEAHGTGFIVGRNGYVLTNSHALPLAEDIKVSYLKGNDSTSAMTTTTAEILLVDNERDLALLKIKPQAKLTSVVFASNAPIKVGEEVTVIGNPGVSDVVLSHSMTTGIVSNANRKIGGLNFIQTSAAVNPGNSGSPVFNSHGEVIGVITLKATIEATAFAVPLNDLQKFLIQAIRP